MFHTIRQFLLLVLLPVQVALWSQNIPTINDNILEANEIDTQSNAIVPQYIDFNKFLAYKKEVAKIHNAYRYNEYIDRKSDQVHKSSRLSNAEKIPPSSLENTESRKFLFGLTVGGGAAWGRYDFNSPNPPPEFSMLQIPTAGIGIDWRIARPFAIHLNMLYKEKSDRTNMDKWLQTVENEDPNLGMTASSSGYILKRLQYLEASIMTVFVFGQRIELGMGAYGAYGFKGQVKTDYTMEYNFEGLGPQTELYQQTIPVEMVLIMPSSVEKDVLYANALDYGLCGHFGLRLNPLKLSLGLQYGMRLWEPDTDLALLLFNSVNHTYNMSATLTLSWFFGGKN